jgi:hypothetical protein
VTNIKTKLTTKQMPGHRHGRAMPTLNKEKHASDRKTAIMLACIATLVVTIGRLHVKIAPVSPSAAPTKSAEGGLTDQLTKKIVEHGASHSLAGPRLDRGPSLL